MQTIIQRVIFYRGDVPERGAVVVLDQRREKHGDATDRIEVQRFLLLDLAETPNADDAGLAWRLQWETTCGECSTTFRCKTNNYTKSLPRRCSACRKRNPYNPDRWMDRPRNRFLRIDPAEGEALPPPIVESVTGNPVDPPRRPYLGLSLAEFKLWVALARAAIPDGEDPKASQEQRRDWIDARLIAEAAGAEPDDIDPASLF